MKKHYLIINRVWRKHMLFKLNFLINMMRNIYIYTSLKDYSGLIHSAWVISLFTGLIASTKPMGSRNTSLGNAQTGWKQTSGSAPGDCIHFKGNRTNMSDGLSLFNLLFKWSGSDNLLTVSLLATCLTLTTPFLPCWTSLAALNIWRIITEGNWTNKKTSLKLTCLTVCL